MSDKKFNHDAWKARVEVDKLKRELYGGRGDRMSYELRKAREQREQTRADKVLEAGSDAGEIDRAELRRVLVDRFNETELRELFFDLDIEYDSLSGEGTRDKAMELIGYCGRRERIGELVEKVKQLRPDISWPNGKNEQEIVAEKSTEDRRIANDRRSQATLEAYFDRMTELLLEKGLRESQESDEVRSIARTRTLAVLRSLDGKRKGQVVQFLYESGLIDLEQPVVDLDGTDLREVDLTGASLWSVNLEGADLREGNLARAVLIKAVLHGTDLRKTDLSKASLRGANLISADLRGTDLRGATLWEADLRGAKLTNAKVTAEQLSQAVSRQGATLPDGTRVLDEATAGEQD